MIEGADLAWLLVALAAVAGTAATLLLGADWLRHRRRTRIEAEPTRRRLHARIPADDPLLAPLGLPESDADRRRL